MNFRINVNIPNYPFQISHQSALLNVGSCFTESIGTKFSNVGFNTRINPFGILFNPVSIANCLDKIASNTRYFVEDLIEVNGLFYSFDHHGKVYDASKEKLLEKINQSINDAHNFLKSADVLIITLGAAWVYTFNETQQIVANCHKIPNNKFSKRLLTIDEVVDSLSASIENIKQLNPNIHLLFTVSPVRHWKDGAHENSLSKSVLHLSVKSLCEKYNAHYFPAYELVIDELRDYRFYNEDMLHPNDVAIKYVWQKFKDAFFDENTKTLSDRVEQFRLMEQHRTLKPNSKEEQLFLEKLKEEKQAISKLVKL
ncbi:MAG: GSCFA domain-containing protein [Bacteroidia bacterium]